jgi:hypothetical protein
MFSVVMSRVVGAAKSTSGVSSFWPALVGAVVGGTVSVATTLLAERQRAKGVTTARQQQQQADAYLASRIIRLELADVESVLRVATQQTSFRWPLSTEYELPTAAWSEYAASLARIVTTDVWEQIALPYSAFKYANLLGTMNLATARSMLAETEAATQALSTAVEAPTN